MSCGTCGIQASETMQEDTGVPAGAPTTSNRPRCPHCQAFIAGPGAPCNNPRCGFWAGQPATAHQSTVALGRAAHALYYALNPAEALLVRGQVGQGDFEDAMTQIRAAIAQAEAGPAPESTLDPELAQQLAVCRAAVAAYDIEAGVERGWLVPDTNYLQAQLRAAYSSFCRYEQRGQVAVRAYDLATVIHETAPAGDPAAHADDPDAVAVLRRYRTAERMRALLSQPDVAAAVAQANRAVAFSQGEDLVVALYTGNTVSLYGSPPPPRAQAHLGSLRAAAVRVGNFTEKKKRAGWREHCPRCGQPLDWGQSAHTHPCPPADAQAAAATAMVHTGLRVLAAQPGWVTSTPAVARAQQRGQQVVAAHVQDAEDDSTAWAEAYRARYATLEDREQALQAAGGALWATLATVPPDVERLAPQVQVSATVRAAQEWQQALQTLAQPLADGSELRDREMACARAQGQFMNPVVATPVPGQNPVAVARTLAEVGWHKGECDEEDALVCQQALAVAQTIGDVRGAAKARLILGVIALRAGDNQSAGQLLEAASAGYRLVGEQRMAEATQGLRPPMAPPAAGATPPGPPFAEADAAAFGELMQNYTDLRTQWIARTGRDTGFDDWFTERMSSLRGQKAGP